jgi:hypothetical protein
MSLVFCPQSRTFSNANPPPAPSSGEDKRDSILAGRAPSQTPTHPAPPLLVKTSVNLLPGTHLLKSHPLPFLRNGSVVFFRQARFISKANTPLSSGEDRRGVTLSFSGAHLFKRGVEDGDEKVEEHKIAQHNVACEWRAGARGGRSVRGQKSPSTM